MERNAGRVVDNFLIHSKAMKLKIINYCFEHPSEKLPTSKELAQANGISDLTVKKIISELAQEGYVQPNKKAGTRITKKFSKKQMQLLEQAREELKKQFISLEKSGFNVQEIIAYIYEAITEYSFEATEILYTEPDFEMIFVGADELSERLNVKVRGVYFENIQKEIDSADKGQKIIITPFYSLDMLKRTQSGVKIFPLHTARPLESLSYSKDIAYGSTIMYVAATEDDKEGALSLQSKIAENMFNLKICKIGELTDNPSLLNSVELVITYKWVINNNEGIFKNVPKIIAYNRFDDKEGLVMIRHYIENNKTKGR